VNSRRRVAFELVGDHHSGQAMAANEYAHQARGRLGVAPTEDFFNAMSFKKQSRKSESSIVIIIEYVLLCIALANSNAMI
jgi:hypothetical protein